MSDPDPDSDPERTPDDRRTEREAEIGTETETVTEAETDTGTDTGTKTDTGTDTEAETKTETDTGTAGDSRPTVAGIDPATDVDVPEGATVRTCSYCGRRLPSEELLVLHRGLDHPDRLDDREVEAFREAYDAEGADVHRFRIVALGVLVVLYFGFLYVYVIIS